jgi:hypothetical protein
MASYDFQLLSFFSSIIHLNILDLMKKTEWGRQQINREFWGWNHMENKHLNNQGDLRITLSTEEQVLLL